jgi:hypothetical protein
MKRKRLPRRLTWTTVRLVAAGSLACGSGTPMTGDATPTDGTTAADLAAPVDASADSSMLSDLAAITDLSFSDLATADSLGCPFTCPGPVCERDPNADGTSCPYSCICILSPPDGPPCAPGCMLVA